MVLQGFRDNNSPNTTTAWPAGLTMGATWDRDALLEWGTGMGKEFFDKGANVQLGPGLCLARVPRNGRNFECAGPPLRPRSLAGAGSALSRARYLSGEDPYLGHQLVQGAIRGIQSQKVVA
jgi:beta-glucosidase